MASASIGQTYMRRRERRPPQQHISEATAVGRGITIHTLRERKKGEKKKEPNHGAYQNKTKTKPVNPMVKEREPRVTEHGRAVHLSRPPPPAK